MADDPVSNSTGPKSMPAWAQMVSYVGIPGLIVFFLLGMIPGTRSPFDVTKEELRAEIRAQGDQTTRTQEAVLRALRAICYRLPNNPSAPSCEQ